MGIERLRSCAWILCGAMVATLSGGCAGAPASPGGQEGTKAEAAENPLEVPMDAMGDAFKALRKQVGNASANASSLGLVATLRENATAARGLAPDSAEAADAAARPAFLEGFRAQIDRLLASLATLEAQLRDGKNDDAARTVEEIVGIMYRGKE